MRFSADLKCYWLTSFYLGSESSMLPSAWMCLWKTKLHQSLVERTHVSIARICIWDTFKHTLALLSDIIIIHSMVVFMLVVILTFAAAFLFRRDFGTSQLGNF
eukprot:TRINITY_DN1523_c0_g1_i2.p1 TRINITY_DN1523_c0_g1~~TRINITY_DN1523_c0_g1_i2.p1  ORF type:complete len:103 (+),score=5.88 TRINITY_DN1523_c0_g1_i2:464-772(+)